MRHWITSFQWLRTAPYTRRAIGLEGRTAIDRRTAVLKDGAGFPSGRSRGKLGHLCLDRRRQRVGRRGAVLALGLRRRPDRTDVSLGHRDRQRDGVVRD